MHTNLFESKEIQEFIERALEEDIREGDHSTMACIPQNERGEMTLLFKDDGVVAGLQLAERILLTLDPTAQLQFFKKDGDRVTSGEKGFVVNAEVHALLKGERLLLNCLQRLSGIATLTHQVVERISVYPSRILDTRKTTPNFRMLEKWAVTQGGGYNHRMGLYDMIMLKDNHIDFAGGITQALEKTKAYLEENDLDIPVEIETRDLEEVKEALKSDIVDRIMLDNFSPAAITEALRLIGGKCETEASGGITLDNIEEYAKTGVDFISMGALTHSYNSLDMSLKHS